ncbi:MAG: response regulator [Ferruginibacter sp.]
MSDIVYNKFLLIDDHEIVRSGMHMLLDEIYKPKEIHEAQDGDSALKLIKKNEYDLIIMDIQMPNTDTFGLMEYIHIKHPDTKVMIFSMGAENIYAKRFLKAGAKGFLSKESSLDEVKKAINLILNNRKYISEHLLDLLAEEAGPSRNVNPFDKLSPKEVEIVSLLLAGHSLTAISNLLNLQASTVGTHKARIFTKLSVKNILELKELHDSMNSRN